MRVIIYAAGVSRRLKSIATNGLKGLIKLNGKRIIEYQLDWVTKEPISEVVIVLGLEHELFKEVLGDSYNGVPIIYVYNPDYKDKGNMLSLWHAREYCDTDILFTTSDLICDERDIEKFNFNSLENKIIPIRQPVLKIIIIFILSKKNGFLKADVINSYFPSIRRINAPLSPGRIVAQTAIIPQKKINHECSGVFKGIRPVMT